MPTHLLLIISGVLAGPAPPPVDGRVQKPQAFIVLSRCAAPDVADARPDDLVAAVAAARAALDALPPADPTAPRLRLRLADLQIAAANDALNRAYDAYQRALEQNPDAPPPAEPGLDIAAPLATLDAFLRDYPKAPHRDLALMWRGWLRQETGADDLAAADYRVVGALKASPLRAEALFRLGNLAFHADRLADARAALKPLVALPESPFTPLGLYFLGWVDYRDGRSADALTTFARLVETRFTDADAAERAALFRPEAVEYLAIVLAGEDDAVDAPGAKQKRHLAALARWGAAHPTLRVEVLGRVALLHDELGHARAAQAVRGLLARD
ncbi:MAG: hypothetical protein KC635_26450, partial [Myxococcales bacterium]|nr:hypothetical protein [Myxococcales bacterium]